MLFEEQYFWAASVERRPICILSNLEAIHDDMFPGRLILLQSGSELIGGRPLSKTCFCHVTHQSSVITSKQEFNSSTPQLLAGHSCFFVSCWHLGWMTDTSPFGLGETWLCLYVSQFSTWPSLSNVSWDVLYGRWCSRELTRLILRDFEDSGLVDFFLSSPVSAGLTASCRVPLEFQCVVISSAPLHVAAGKSTKQHWHGPQA